MASKSVQPQTELRTKNVSKFVEIINYNKTFAPCKVAFVSFDVADYCHPAM